ncbi:MAG: NAD-dependent epimerase/dehydratase family protein [Deltaproteobacteria bacterium]
MEMNVLITGGAGFAGSNMAVYLKLRNPEFDVVSLDNLKRRGSELNLPRLKKCGVRFIHGDIRNREDLAFEGLSFKPDVVIESSAEPSVLAGYDGGAEYVINTNLGGTINCLEAARKWAAAFLFLSTSRVYPIEKLNALNFTEKETRFELDDDQEIAGASGRGISGDFTLRGFRSLYGATKLCSEHMIEEYRAMYGMKCVVNRCGVIAGPWQMGRVDQGVFVHWVGSHYFNRELRYFGYGGTGKQVRDLLHIDDLCALADWQIKHMEAMDGEVFNVGGGQTANLSLCETTSLCGDITGNRVKVTGERKERAADVRVYITDTGHVQSVTGWAPRMTAADVLNDIFRWIRTNEREVKGVLFG